MFKQNKSAGASSITHNLDEQRQLSQGRPELPVAVTEHIAAWDQMVTELAALKSRIQSAIDDLSISKMHAKMLEDELMDVRAERDYYRDYASEMSTSFMNIADTLGGVMRRAKLAPYKNAQERQDQDTKKEPRNETNSQPMPSVVTRGPRVD